MDEASSNGSGGNGSRRMQVLVASLLPSLSPQVSTNLNMIMTMMAPPPPPPPPPPLSPPTPPPAPASASASQEMEAEDRSLTVTPRNNTVAYEDEFQSRKIFKSEEYRQLFHLPFEEVLIEDFNCALQKKILVQGHMYIFEHYVCFYSNIFGFEKKKVIPIKDITSIRKAKTAGLFANAIEIFYFGKKSFFASFLSRDEAFRVIEEKWYCYSEHGRLFVSCQGHGAEPNQPPCVLQDSLVASAVSKSNTEIRKSEEALEESSQLDIEPEDVENPELIVNDGDATCAIELEEDFAPNDTTNLETLEVDAPQLPSHYKTLIECEFPMDIQEFLKTFFSNEAIGFTESFHRKCNDEELCCTQWSKHDHFGYVRDVSFRHPVNLYFGPKAASCQELQRYRIYQANHLILETSKQMNDVPYGDCFRVEVRWDVKNKEEQDAKSCSVCISYDIPFSKKTLWRGKIEQGTYEECKKSYLMWIEEAKRHLSAKNVDNCRVVDTENNNRQQTTSIDEKKEVLNSIRTGITSTSTLKQQLKTKPEGKVLVLNECASQDTIFPSTKRVERSILSEKPGTSKTGSQKVGGTSSSSPNPAKTSPMLNMAARDEDLEKMGRFKLALFAGIIAIVLLTQVSTLIALARLPRVQDNHWSSSSMFEDVIRKNRVKNSEVLVGLYERRINFLVEEAAMAEAWTQSLQFDLTTIKSRLQVLLENNPWPHSRTQNDSASS